MSVDLKSKYGANGWERYNDREAVALFWLKMMGFADVKPVGFATMESEQREGFHTGDKDRFDFYSPSLKCYFEVTGTDWTRNQSARRCARPILAVLKAKVDAAAEYGLTDSLWFVSVNEMQGEIRLYPCKDINAVKHSLLNYASGESAYYGIPWDQWLTPARAQGFLMKRVTA